MKNLWSYRPQGGGALAIRIILALVVTATFVASTPSSSADAARGPRQSQSYEILRSPVVPEQEQDLPGGRRPGGSVRLKAEARKQLHEATNLDRAELDTARSKVFAKSQVKQAVDPDMKVLVISADGSETDLPAIKAFLDQVGIPYTALIAKNTPLTAAMLSDGVAHGYYDAVMLATGSLIYYDPATNSYPSALSVAQWQTLWTYEAQYKVRQVTSFTAPGQSSPDSYGLTYAGGRDTTNAPLTGTLTATGKQVFSYLNTASPITIQNAWAYFGSNPDATTTPLLTTPQGYVLASIHAYPDGRQNLAVTVANNPYLLHSMLLSYGVINWVTKGVFLGERHVNIGVQPDDLFIENDSWDPTTLTDTSGQTYRMTGADYNRAATWQAGVQSSSPLTSAFRIEWPFNGKGTTGIYSPDTLTPAVKANPNAFNFISHTYTHLNLDPPVTAAQITTQLTKNDQVATKLSLRNYSRTAFVQPDISGINWDRLNIAQGPGTDPAFFDHDNPAFFLSALNFGIRYVISDASRPNWSNPTPNAGYYSVDQPNILIIPRRANNLFYNLTTPAQWVSEYNCYYGPTGTCANGAWRFWSTNLTYAQILDQESNNLLGYMLRWDLDPWMFHQPAMGLYDGTHSLLSDLLDMTFAKYKAAYNLPIRNLAERDLGPKMAARMAYNASGVKASVSCPATGTIGGTITIKAVNPATIPVTGVASGTNTENYGGQIISYLTLAANQTVTIPAPAAACGN